MVKFARDENAPKRAQSAYFRFLGDVRPRVVEQYPALRSNIAAFGKYVGNLWKNVDEQDRAAYQRAADADRAVYTEKMNAYRQTEEFAAYQKARKEFNKKNKVGRQLKALKKTLVNQPKRAASGYMQFGASIRAGLVAQNPTWGVADLGRAIGEAWSKLSEEEKAPFNQKYEAAKAVYQRELAAYRETEEWTNYLVAKKNVRGAVKEAERAKKQKAKDAAKAKNAAAKVKVQAAKEKVRAKKAAAKQKLVARKEALKAKAVAKKEALKSKKEAAKQKVVARKEAKKAKVLAAKQRVAERKTAKKQKLASKKAKKAARKQELKEKAATRKAALRAKVLAQRQRAREIAQRRVQAEKAKKLRMRLREKAQKQRSRVLAAKK